MSDDQATPDGSTATGGVERVTVIGCPPGTRDRLLAALGATEVDATDGTGPDVIVISTRARVRDLPTEPSAPVVALVHPGGNEAARRFLEAGVLACVPEGREELVAGVVGAPAESPLTDPLRVLLDAPPPPDRLPDDVARTLVRADGAEGRIVVVEVPALADLTDRIGTGVSALVRARIERTLASVAPDAAWTALSSARYLVAAPSLAADHVPDVATRLADTVALFRGLGPDGATLHVGHAGPEDADDARIRLDLAESACDLAVLEARPDASVADVLERRSLPQAAQVLLDLADAADTERADAPSSRLVADIAAGVAGALEWDHEDVDVARLAGRLHAVGAVGTASEDEDERRAYLRARLVGVDPRVLTAIERHAEPAGSDDGPPEAARVLAVALATAAALHRGDALAGALEQASGLDPAIAAIALERYAVPEPAGVAAS